MSERPPEEGLTPAEARVLGLLLLLRGADLRADPALARTIVNSARWQRVVREALAAVGSLAAALVDGLAGLSGLSRRQGRKP
jgi:hypothetical protein